MKPEGFPRHLRLRRRAEFLRVQRTGVKHHMRNFLVFVASQPVSAAAAHQNHQEALPSDLPPARLGVTVTRKVGGSVARNRIKRLVREAFRRERQHLAAGVDMVWVAKQGIEALSYLDVVDDLRRLQRRLGKTAADVQAPSRR